MRGTEWWVGGGTPEAIDRAARLGDCWYGNADLTTTSARVLIEIYREACARHGFEPSRIPNSKGCVHRRDGPRCRKVGRCELMSCWRIWELIAVPSPTEVSRRLADQLAVLSGEIGYTDIIIRTMPAPWTERCGRWNSAATSEHDFSRSEGLVGNAALDECEGGLT